MPEPRHIPILVEGHEEHATLSVLQARGLLPAHVEIVRPGHEGLLGRPGGTEGLLFDLRRQLAIPRTVVLRDYDDLDAAGVLNWLITGLKPELAVHNVTPPSAPAPSLLVELKPSDEQAIEFVPRVALAPIGLRGEAEMTKWSVDWFALDDYLFRLATNRIVYEATPQLRDFSYDVAMEKLDRVRTLMLENKVEVRKSQRLLQLLMGITGFRPSPAILAQRLVEKAFEALGHAQAEALFNPLLADLRAAIALLES